MGASPWWIPDIVKLSILGVQWIYCLATLIHGWPNRRIGNYQGVLRKWRMRWIILGTITTVFLFILGSHDPLLFFGWQYYCVFSTLSMQFGVATAMYMSYLGTCVNVMTRNLSRDLPEWVGLTYTILMVVYITLGFVSMIAVLSTGKKVYGIMRHLSSLLGFTGAAVTYMVSVVYIIKVKSRQSRSPTTSGVDNSSSKSKLKAISVRSNFDSAIITKSKSNNLAVPLQSTTPTNPQLPQVEESDTNVNAMDVSSDELLHTSPTPRHLAMPSSIDISKKHLHHSSMKSSESASCSIIPLSPALSKRRDTLVERYRQKKLLKNKSEATSIASLRRSIYTLIGLLILCILFTFVNIYENVNGDPSYEADINSENSQYSITFDSIQWFSVSKLLRRTRRKSPNFLYG